MPRTKRVQSLQTEQKKLEAKFLSDFKRKSAIEMVKMKTDMEQEINKYLDTISIEITRFSPEIQNMSLGEICNMLNSPDSEEEEENITPKIKTISQNNINAIDHGYVTDKTSSSEPSVSSVLKKRVRVEPKSMTKKTQVSKKHLQTNASSNIYSHTPKNKQAPLGPITPKVAPNTPVNVLRRPRCGETVISMTGSPLLVSTYIQEEQMANLMLPLNNGDVLSILPTGNLRESLLPNLSPNTVQQLKTLKRHIEKFLPKDDDESQK